MRAIVTMVVVLISLGNCGCQEIRLRDRTLQLAGTTPQLHQQQVLDNLARSAADPTAFPYFLMPSQGNEQIARTFQLQYSPTWDFITSGAYIGRYLFDKQGAQIQGTNQNQETWQGLPVCDPDKLLLMQSALHRVLGISDPYQPVLDQFYASHSTWAHYRDMIEQDWVFVGNKHDVPKNACYVGHHCNTYVWVMANQKDKLAKLTFAILDILTVDPSAIASVVTTFVPKTDHVLPASAVTPQNVPLKAIREALLKKVVGNKYPTEEALKQAITEAIKSIGVNADATVINKLVSNRQTTTIMMPTQTIQRPILTPRIIPFPLATPPASSPVP